MQTLEDKNHELMILNRIAEALNREVDLPRALHVALGNIVDLFHLQTGWIFLIDETTGKFYTGATIGLPPALANHPRRLGGTCYCIDTYLDGDMEGAANINAITCSRLKDLKEGTQGILYHASIPLYAQTKQLGVLNVASTDWREISVDELRLLHTVGDLLSMAVERARLFQRSKELGIIDERNRLAREIHDTIAQGLAAITLQLETAELFLEESPKIDSARKAVNSALKLARINLEEARRSVLDLRLAPLDGRSLDEAITLLLDALETRSNLEVIGSSPQLPLRVQIGLYRIAQEAITNIQKHAEATLVNVQIILMPERVGLIIEDNGIGFDVNQGHREGHYGLVGIQERVRLLHGKLDIISCQGGGTVLEVNIPLEVHHE